MRYKLKITDRAREQLRRISPDLRRSIGAKLDALQTDLLGDVRKLSGRSHEYRLRVGSHRVLFTLEADTIVVYTVRDRKDVYE